MLLNQGVYGVVLIVDDQQLMKGLYTDGDVRRALLNGADLGDAAELHMNQEFTFATDDMGHMERINRLSEKIRHLPILDQEGRPVDMISWAEYWRLPVMEPSLGGNELRYVSDCISSNWISSQGLYINRFEETFRAYHSIEHSLSTSSGTAALHLALLALGVGRGDEVVVPNLTFAATANAVLHCGATPVFVDVDRETWTLDPSALDGAINSTTRAIIPVHLYGHPCNMDPIMRIAQRYNIPIVEDCAEALGAEYKGRLVGTFGTIACFSFFANKVITTGEGGMVITRDGDLHEKMTILRDHGMSRKKRYWHLVPGFNFRLTNLQAAVGLAQMERINDFIDLRLKLAEMYDLRLADLEGVRLPPRAPWAKNIYWLYSIIIDDASDVTRDDLAQKLRDLGIETRPFFYPLHEQPPYKTNSKQSFPVSSWLSERGLSLPTASSVRSEDVDRVCRTIREVISR